MISLVVVPYLVEEDGPEHASLVELGGHARDLAVLVERLELERLKPLSIEEDGGWLLAMGPTLFAFVFLGERRRVLEVGLEVK